MTDHLDEVHARRERRQRRFEVKEEKNKPVLPGLPGPDDLDGQCAWLTNVLHLDPHHPITGGTHAGLTGRHGHITLVRQAAPPLKFKPASRISKGAILNADLVWQLQPSDGKPYPWSDQQAIAIARVVHLLCDASTAITSRQETLRVLTAYIDASEQVDGNTYGNTGERYEAAVALRPELDEKTGKVRVQRYLVDTTRPEIAIRVSDLAYVARQVNGSSLEHGWLDAQMAEFGWRRVSLQGQSIHGRDGRVRGNHAHADVYRGPIASVFGDEAVNP